MIANPLDNKGTRVAELFNDLPNHTTLSKFDSHSYRLAKNEFGNGHWTNPNETLGMGEGAIIFNPTSDYKTLSFVGEVRRGRFSIPVPGGFTVQSSRVPQPGSLETDLGFPVSDGDVI